MTELRYVPKTEIERALHASNDPLICGALFATLCRINVLYMIARAGSGHIGSSFSSLDITAWLYLEELRQNQDGTFRDVFFSSKGHDAPALYAVLIGLGMLPFDKLHALRRLGGLPGHPDVSVDHITVNSGSLGMGISKAKGIIRADRLDGRNRRIFVMTGDGELQEGQIWESLQGATNAKMHELSVIVDHNKIQSDHWVTDTSDLGNLDARFASFGWQVQRCDGHDLAAFKASLDKRRADNRPGVIIADTVKGRGVGFMEPKTLGHLEQYRYHSGAPSSDEYHRALAELIASANRLLQDTGAKPLGVQGSPNTTGTVPSLDDTPERLIPAYGKALIAAARKNEKLIALDADLALDCGLIPFRETFPKRYVECGIAEMDMVSQAGGLALAGKLPVVHSFACFLTPRANEQIYTNATEGTKIIYVGSLAGLIPAGPGHSHQSVRDIALMSCVPGLTAFEPSTEAEAAAAIRWMVEHAEGPCYLRLASIPVVLGYRPSSKVRLEPGHGTVLRDGHDAILFAYGPVMLTESIKAANTLARTTGSQLRVVNMPWLNRIDGNWLREIVDGFRLVLTVDNHYLSGGQGERIAATLAESGTRHGLVVRRFGLNSVPVCGTNDEVLHHHALDGDSLAETIRKAIDDLS